MAGGQRDGDEPVALAQVDGAQSHAPDVRKRRQRHALDDALAGDEHEIALVLALDRRQRHERRDVLVRVKLQKVYDVRSLRRAGRRGNLIALHAENAAHIGEKQHRIVRFRDEHRRHGVLLAQGLAGYAASAAPLGTVGRHGQALDITRLRQREGIVLVFDQILDVELVVDQLDLRAALVGVFFADLEDLALDDAVLQLVGDEDPLVFRDFCLQTAQLLLELVAFEPCQAAHAHIDDRLRLLVGQPEAVFEVFLRDRLRFRRADDMDDLVDVVDRDFEAFQDMRALFGAFELKPRPAGDDLLLKGDVLAKHLL